MRPTSHQLRIEHCRFSSATTKFLQILFHQDSYSLNLHMENTTINTSPSPHLQNFITYLRGVQYIVNTTASYNISIRDCCFDSSGGLGTAVHAEFYAASNGMPSLTQGLHFSRCVLTRNHMYLRLHSRRIGPSIAPNIVIEHSTIINLYRSEHAGLRIVSNDDLKYGNNSILLRNVSFQYNSHAGVQILFNPSQVYLQSVIYLLFAHSVSFQDCSFIGNRCTPIAAHYSSFKVSGTLTFINNTAYQGAALAFYGSSYMNVSNNTHIVFINNHAEHVGGAIFVRDEVLDNSYTLKCFFQFAFNNQIIYLNGGVARSSLNISLTFANNTARDGGDAIYGGNLKQSEVTNCFVRRKSCKGDDIFTPNTTRHHQYC